MAKPRLRFLARGEALVADVHAQERTNSVRRFIGRRWQEILPGRWGWAPTGASEETDYHADLVKACRDGDLWPADEATAKACGAPFDPLYGEEKTETIKDFKARLAQSQDDPPKATDKPADKSARKEG